MADMILAAVCILLVVAVALLIVILKKVAQAESSDVGARLESFEKAQERTERMLREEVARTREELTKSLREQRQELIETISLLTNNVSERLNAIRGETTTGAKQLREELSSAISKLAESNEKRFEAIRVTVEGKLEAMQGDNNRQLDRMRQTVDEKLQGTLEKRLGESFKQVSERLEQVHQGLGEMQTLASGVGDLKKVLTNVKTRGTWGEVQLGALLEQVLNPAQYATNVAVKDGSGERVEFAIKLPGQGSDKDEAVLLPIDSKFPLEDYQRLIDAQERADAEAAELAGKKLELQVRACAKDIRDKYLNPPRSTDFGILFLPLEGLFAEVIRRPGLPDFVQREYRVVIAGPTTLWSILNSLQMGFKTLAVQKRSSEVWNLLAAVKTEWTKYGEVLEAVHKKLHQASQTLDKVTTRSKAVGRKLRDVQELPMGDASQLLPLNMAMDEPENDDENEAEDIFTRQN